MDIMNIANHAAIPKDPEIQNAKTNSNTGHGDFSSKMQSALDTNKTSATTADSIKSLDGTKIATDIKKLSDFAKEFEHYIISTIWKAAYSSSKTSTKEDISEIIYGDQFIDKIVADVYDEPGPFAKAVSAKLIEEYGGLLEAQTNESERVKTKL